MGPRELAEASLRLTRDGDREGWLELFADDAIVEDPVGSEPHRGIEAIRRFRDSVIATMDSFDYQIERCYVGGDEAALVVTFSLSAGGSTLVMDLVNIYRANAEGKIASLRSFWDGSRQGG
jgi:steroid delta-isomerase